MVNRMSGALKRKTKVVLALLACFLFLVIGIGYAFTNGRTRGEDYTSPYIPPVANATATRQFFVDWRSENKTTDFSSEYVKKGIPFKKTISFSTPNLREIQFNLRWTDDKTTLHHRFGNDKIILKVRTPAGVIYRYTDKTSKKDPYGNIQITIPVSSNQTSSFYLNCSDITEAEQNVLLNCSDYTWVNENFTIQVLIRIGGIRPLKRFADKGNDFSLEVITSVYTPYIKQV